MRKRILLGCSAVLALGAGLSSAPAAACPWNGCGTDASNLARARAYYYDPIYGYVPMAYGNAAYGYAPIYAAPVYGYGPMYGYAPPTAYSYYTAPARAGVPVYRYRYPLGASQIGYQGR